MNVLTSPFYKALKRTYEHFSGGLSFFDADTIRMRQVSRLAQCWLKKEDLQFDFSAQKVTHGNPHEWSGRIYVTIDGVPPGTVEELREARR